MKGIELSKLMVFLPWVCPYRKFYQLLVTNRHLADRRCLRLVVWRSSVPTTHNDDVLDQFFPNNEDDDDDDDGDGSFNVARTNDERVNNSWSSSSTNESDNEHDPIPSFPNPHREVEQPDDDLFRFF